MDAWGQFDINFARSQSTSLLALEFLLRDVPVDAENKMQLPFRWKLQSGVCEELSGVCWVGRVERCCDV